MNKILVGDINGNELHYLRRDTDRKYGSWTEQSGRNIKLVHKLDADGDGSISVEEFVTYYDSVLPEQPHMFAKAMKEFRKAGELSRKDAGGSTAPITVTVLTPASSMEKRVAKEAGKCDDLKVEAAKLKADREARVKKRENTALPVDVKTQECQ